MSNFKILVFGAGSVGAHHTNAARYLNANVYITDINNQQLDYFKSKLYPGRYGKWDKKIEIIKYENVFKKKIKYDLIILGISPYNHLKILKKCIIKLTFKALA